MVCKLSAMNTRLFYRTGSGLIMLLGLLHLAAHLGFEPDEAALATKAVMEAHTIDLFGKHTLYKFHTGFSFFMGISIGFYGL